MSFLDFFRSKARILQCPYCLTSVAVANMDPVKCSSAQCGREFPPLFLKNYQKAPPLLMPMMGHPNAGKTSFLMAATVAIVRSIEFWGRTGNHPDHYALTDESHEFVEHVKRCLRTGKLQEPTQEAAIRLAYLIQMLRIPRWGDRIMVLRDVPGEHFSSRRRTIDAVQIPFLANAPSVFLFYDPTKDREGAGSKHDGSGDRHAVDPEDRTIDHIFRAYVMGLQEKAGVEFGPGNRRKVVVVITKADEIKDLPLHLKNYLETDEHWDAELRDKNFQSGDSGFTDQSMARYMERLFNVSSELRKWILTQPGGKALIAAAETTNHVELHFCMVSSIPCGVEWSSEGLEPRAKWQDPSRILDPIYWALELNSRPVR